MQVNKRADGSWSDTHGVWHKPKSQANNEPKFVVLDADQQGHLILLLHTHLQEIKQRAIKDGGASEDLEADLDDLTFNSTMYGHLIDNKLDEDALEYLTMMDEEQSNGEVQEDV